MHLKTAHIGGYRVEVGGRPREVAYEVAYGLLAMLPERLHDGQFLVSQFLHIEYFLNAVLSFLMQSNYKL